MDSIDAFVNNSQPLDDLLTEKDKGQDLYADSVYTRDDQQKVVSKYEMNNYVPEKGYRNKPRSDEQKKQNGEKSIIRAKVEHIFWFM